MLRGALIVVALAAASGCALAIRGTRQSVGVDSDPRGAVATADGESCVTPCALSAKRGDDAVVTVTREGFEPAAVTYRSRLGETTLLCLLVPMPGAIGCFAADVGSGAAYDLFPPEALIQLQPAQGGGGAPPAPPVPRVLAPLEPIRRSLSLDLGFGAVSTEPNTLFAQIGAVGTWRLRDPFVAGVAAAVGQTFVFPWEGTDPVGVTTLAAVGGVGVAPSRNSRLLALALAGVHRYESWGGRASLPVVGARASWTAVFSDAFTPGLYVSWLWDLDRRELSAGPYDPPQTLGGRTVIVGFTLGRVVR